MEQPSDIQERLFRFIHSHMNREQRPPSYDEMRRAVGLKSRSNVRYHLDALENLGFLERDRGMARGIRLRVEASADPDVVSVPLSGYIVAGQPVFTSTVEEALQLTRDIVPGLGPLFALRVKGDSMKDAHVSDGDIVVLRRQESARNGDMVAVRLTDRDEYTLKHFYRERGKVRLKPANPAYPDILVHPSSVEVQGRVVTVIRQYLS